MSVVYTSADQLIGNTPLLELTHIEKKTFKHASWPNWNISIQQDQLKIVLPKLCLMMLKPKVN